MNPLFINLRFSNRGVLMDIFRVLNPGMMTTVQDLGRFGFLDSGVPPSGALDSFSCRVANLLVGNPENLAVLEITVVGPTLEAMTNGKFAITGAEMGATLNGVPLASWQTIAIKKGDIVRLSRAHEGCRAYLAVNGGFDVPLLMGSRSTFVRAQFGGFKGRMLRKGDILKKGPGMQKHECLRSLPREFVPAYPKEVVLTAIPGPQEDFFHYAIDRFFSASYQVMAQSDRMGCRLQGPSIEHDKEAPDSIVTEPTIPGNIQIPADGQPIILLVEQTTGGYSKIATVISTNIRRVAQLMPGNTIRFERTTIEKARFFHRESQNRLQRIREALL
jgi:biotin-dependent carboxylase-like uncharacterized protein